MADRPPKPRDENKEREIKELRQRLAFLEGRSESEVSETVLEEQLALLTMGSEIGHTLVTARDLDRVVDKCVRIMGEHLGAALTRIWTVDRRNETLVLRASHGLSERIDGRFSRIPFGRGIIGQVAATQKVTTTDNLADHTLLLDREWVRGEDLKSFIGQPMLVNDRLIGVIGLFFGCPLRPVTFEALETLADQIAIGLDRLIKNKALHDQDATLRSLLQAAPVGIGMVTNRILGWTNDHLSWMTGYRPEELKGRSARVLYPSQEEFERVGRIKHAEVRNKGLGSIETVFKCKDGRLIDVFMSSTAIDPNNWSQGLVFTALDITERKRAEEEVRASRARLAQSQRIARVGNWELDLRTNTIRASKEAFNIYGLEYSDGRLDLEAAQAVVLDEDRPNNQKSLVDLINQGREYDIEFRVKRANDGRIRYIHSIGELIRDENGQPIRVVGTLQDITDRVKDAEKIKESELRYRGLFESITDFIYTHDPDGRILSINPLAAESLGYRPEEMIGKRLSDLMPDRHREAYRQDFLPRLRDEGLIEGVLVLEAKDGRELYLEYRSILVENNGQGAYISGSGRDVTERVQTERQMRKLEEQLIHSQKMEAIGNLASGVAHDFNNILQVISGHLQLWRERRRSGDERPIDLSGMENSVEKAVDLIKRLLTFSRKADRELVSVDLNHEIELSITLLKRTLPKMVSIEAELAPDLRVVRADPNQLNQILMNLASNAVDAMEGSGRITILTENLNLSEDHSETLVELEPGPYISLSVTDTGAGMDRETLSHVFEPFFTTKDVGEGTGLGLASVYGIVKSHGGHIEGRSRLGRGTTFRIYLPAAKDPGTVSLSSITEENGHPTGTETILLVDDETDILALGKEVLESYGYQVLIADRGERALEVYGEASTGIDLVVLDLGMPGMGGFACLAELLKINPAAKVIIASGYSMNGQATLSLESGAAAFVAKPYRFGDLLQRIRSILDSSSKTD